MRLNGAALQAASTGFQAVFLEAFEAAEPMYPGYVMEVESTGSREEYHFGDLLSGMREWLGDREIEALNRDAFQIRNRTWEKTIGIPREAYEDDQLGVYKSQVRALAALAKQHPDELLVELIEGGFTGLCYDGVAFFSASHPITGGVQSNLVSGALSATTFESALLKLRSMKGKGGRQINPLAAGGKLTLTVGPANEAAGKEILVKEYIDGGDSNPDYKAAELKVNPYIAGTHWMLSVNGGALAAFILQMRRRAQLIAKDRNDDEDAFKKNRFLFGCDGRWNMGYGLYQLAVGSTGA